MEQKIQNGRKDKVLIGGKAGYREVTLSAITVEFSNSEKTFIGSLWGLDENGTRFLVNCVTGTRRQVTSWAKGEFRTAKESV